MNYDAWLTEVQKKRTALNEANKKFNDVQSELQKDPRFVDARDAFVKANTELSEFLQSTVGVNPNTPILPETVAGLAARIVDMKKDA